ncbi:hypothetical protein RJT34_17785 [Clitoria ternatea]|uniref:Uncharacterized protein n=1 Tax=Clitoria ternatea TaxID=43366 RepID=A0AAN9JB45_CLITE
MCLQLYCCVELTCMQRINCFLAYTFLVQKKFRERMAFHLKAKNVCVVKKHYQNRLKYVITIRSYFTFYLHYTIPSEKKVDKVRRGTDGSRATMLTLLISSFYFY